ncbi:unnamed protein product [Mytilus coruscus]|uniref:Uncharacterized protein n=1 Tax=Mytilus coruscus TaxID=42192 RepID=A0A6J8B9B1_MYTCO|nr:unnamed protein product [Mytilus coruscus]
MPGRGKGLRSRRTPDSPCENLTTSDRQWDLNNPSNWTVQKLRELDKQGIKTPSSLSKSAIAIPKIFRNRTNSEIIDTSGPLSAEPDVAAESSSEFEQLFIFN